MTIKNTKRPKVPEIDNSGGRKWKISKVVEGKKTCIHIKQVLKPLLPCEYISRCHQQRHWASQYLQGKEHVNPKQ